MTRILVASDIHSEFDRLGRLPPLPNEDEYDAVLLAGDLGLTINGMMWALATFPHSKTLIMLNGNHEYYHGDKTDVRRAQQAVIGQLIEAGRPAPVILLDPGTYEIGNTVIIGATLWSSLELKGFYDHRTTDLMFERSIADFKLIYDQGKRRTADDHRADFEREQAFIKQQLEEYKDSGRTIVVATHFVPSQMCIDPIYANSPLNPYFTVDMDDLMLDYSIDTWFFGHTHSKMSKVHPSGTKLICNPAGYPGEHQNFSWDIYTFE